MATNDLILEQIADLKKWLGHQIEDVRRIANHADGLAIKNDVEIRGNGKEGIKSQIAMINKKIDDNKKTLDEIKWYFRGVVAAVIIDLVSQLIIDHLI